jgi:amino acid adenylation domain-containing protein
VRTPRLRHTLFAAVEAQAARAPDAVAIRTPEEAWSYATLVETASRIAESLLARGLNPGDLVGVHLAKSPRTIAILLGILKARAAYVPIDPWAPKERVRFLLQHGDIRWLFSEAEGLGDLASEVPLVRLLVTDEVSLQSASSIAENIVGFDEMLAGPSTTPSGTPASEEDVAYVLYTSGSTGDPKGVVVTHRQSLAFVRAATDRFSLRKEDVLASHAPLGFDLSIFDLFAAFEAGASVAILSERWTPFPARIVKAVADLGVTVWNSVPSVIVQLLQRGGLEKIGWPKVRLVLFSGEVFPRDRLNQLRAALPSAQLFNVYGQTEANSSTCFEVVTDLAEGESLPIGSPLPGYEVFLLGDDGKEVTAPGGTGEICVAGEAVTSGYLGAGDRNAASFIRHPFVPEANIRVYRTGDLGNYRADGEMMYLGRKDRLIKCRGFRVDLTGLEAAAESHFAAEKAAVVAVPDEALGHRLALYVEAEKHPLAPSALESYLRKKLPAYFIPEHIEVREKLPRSSTDKVDYRALLAEARQRFSDL